MEDAWQPRPPATRWSGDSFAIGVALGSARLAHGQPQQALDGLTELNAAMQAQQATRTWARRQAMALTALAQSRLGATTEALALLAASDRESEALSPPSMADQADQAALRAQVLHAAGRQAEATAALKEMRANLDGQHTDSPRQLAAQRLADALGR